MQITSDGKPKLIERIDASGAGDVEMTKEAEVVDGYITGLTGLKMKMPSDWCEKNVKNNKFRIGCKRVYSLYPKILRERMQKEKVEKAWDPHHKKSLAQITNAIEQFESSKRYTSMFFQQSFSFLNTLKPAFFSEPQIS